LEQKYEIKLKLGPNDFGIHKRPLYSLELDEDVILPVKIISPGRWPTECIGKINEDFVVKILLNSPLEFSSQMVGKEIDVKILKSTRNDNLITTFVPF